jgi:hypothetical protein
MKVKIIISILFLFAAGVGNIFSQIINQPDIGLKSPEIRKIEITPEKTIIYLTIENRIEGGYFCADKNIFVLYPDGSRIKLVNAVGIPECPETYKFKSTGEVLVFTLTFPPLKPLTQWIDIIEECAGNCFYLYGVTLNNELNKRLDEAFILAAKGEPGKTILLFRNILESVDSENPGIEGSLYINIISAAIEAGDKVEAAVWYKRLLSSNAPRLSQYVKFLNDRGIKY